jgi:hypothetical protein
MRAGAAAVDVGPAPGLPMIGFVRRQNGATGSGLSLEATALVLEEGPTRVVLCGVDTLGIQSPEVDRLRERLADAAGAEPAAVLMNWSHTHCAPPATPTLLARSGLLAAERAARVEAYSATLFDRLQELVQRAADRLEPARTAWGVGEVDLSVNRRERAPSGEIVHGWRVDGLLDRQVVALRAARPDGSAIATLVGYGCHTVSVGMDVQTYSADFAGPLRERIRAWTGGECVFFQGAAGNVLPRISFGPDEGEARRIGERLALEAVHCLADRDPWPKRLVREMDGSLIPMILFRYADEPDDTVELSAVEARLDLPLRELPTVEELEALSEEYEAAVAEAEARAAGDAERYGLLFHAKWARLALAEVAAGTASTSVAGSVHAVRIGNGAIVTAPGEPFTELGLAVKERSPGRPTLYAGYTNGAVGYFPTAAAYDEGGYEPAYSNRSYGQPAPMAPECERLLVETGVRLAESLFPEREPFSGDDWSAKGTPPTLPVELVTPPSAGAFAPPRTAKQPG